MPEQIYRDLTPCLVDVPPSTWDVDPESAFETLISRVPEEKRAEVIQQGLGAIASAVRFEAPSPELRERLERTAPHLLAVIDEELRIQDLDYEV